MQKFQDVILDQYGNVVQNASITVYNAGTLVKATIFSDNGITITTNPVTTDSLGRYYFYAAAGRYDLAISGSKIVSYTETDVLLQDSTADLANTSTTTLGDYLVGYKASNSGGALTGSIARTVHQKFQDFYITPEEFGAVGDGTTDDTAAIQAWINAIPASAGGTSPGYTIGPTSGKKYKLSSVITIGNRRIVIVGPGIAGSGAPSIFYQSNSNADFFDFTTGNSDVLSVMGVFFLGTGTGTGTGRALVLGRTAQACFDSRITNNWFASIPATCIDGINVSGVHFSNNGIEGTPIGLRIALGDDNKVFGNRFFSCTTAGLKLELGSWTSVNDNTFDFCGSGDDVTGAILLNNSSTENRGLRITDNTFNKNYNDITILGTASASGHTGCVAGIIDGNVSDFANRRFVYASSASRLSVTNNRINDPNQSNASLPAIEIGGTSDYCYVDGNAAQRAGAIVMPYGLTLGATTTNNVVGVNDFVGDSGQVNITAGATFANKQLLQGTWTPSVGGNATYTLQEGYWQKIGQLVFCQFKIVINTIGTGSTTTVSGLPFTAFSAANASSGKGSVGVMQSLATNVVSLTIDVTNNASTITFDGFAAAAANTTNGIAVFGNSTRIDGSFVYLSA